MKKKYDINSFNDYIEFLKKILWGKKEELWYRGQINNDWKLETNLYRNKVLDIGDSGISILKYKIPNFLKEFKNFADKIKEENIIDISNLNKFQVMFLGQHYGLLTPVLDWTTDPLAAMFFALDGYEKNNKEKYPVIYILNPCKCNRNSGMVWSDNSNIEEVICIDGADMDCYFEEWIGELMNPASPIPIALCSKKEYSFRISRQSGNFTLIKPVQPISYQWNDIVIEGKSLVKQITINPDAVDEICLYLKMLNVNRSTLYKNDHDELDATCVKIKNESLADFEINRNIR